MAYINSLLNRSKIVHGGKILTIIIIRVQASSYRLLLLGLCDNGCAEASVVKRKFSIESHLLCLMTLNS